MKKLIVVVLVVLLVSMVAYGQEWKYGTSKIYSYPYSAKVGIGTSSPKHNLEVEGTIETDYLYPSQGDGTPYRYLRFGDNSAFWAGFMWNYNSPNYGDGDDFSIYTYNDRDMTFYTGTGNIIMFPSSGGNVGIGTTSPADKLDVNGIVKMSGFKLTAGFPEDGDVLAYNGTSGEGEWRTISGGGGSCLWDGDLSEAYYMGEVGIGTTSPASKLHLHTTSGNCEMRLTTDATTYSHIYFGTDRDGSLEWGHIGLAHNGGNKLLKIAATGNIVTSNHLNIKENGNVGIGTTSPADKLDVNGIVKMSGFKLTTGSPEDGDVLTYNGTSGEGEWRTISGGGGSCLWDGDSSKIYYMGNVGIGMDNPTAKLHVAGDMKIPYENKMVFGEAYIKGYLDSYGGLKFYGGGGGGAGNLAITVNPSGKVGIATDDPQSELAVNGTITAKEVVVTLDGWSDFVFSDKHKLMPLDKLEKHIDVNKSLPGIPTEREVLEGGVKVGDMQAKLLEKVEELTLYVIEQNKQISELEKKIARLEAEN